MRLCNSRIPEEYLVCYQTSQHNWVIIKMLYRCLRRCLLGWHRLRLGFVTPSIERYLWALSVMHIIWSLASNVTNDLVAGWCITERVKRLAGNEIELGMMIPTIESWASNIPITKGTTYVVPFVIGMLLARDSIISIIIPSSMSLLESLFTRSVIHHLVTNSLVTLLARLLMMCITERAQRYLSDTRSDKS